MFRSELMNIGLSKEHCAHHNRQMKQPFSFHALSLIKKSLILFDLMNSASKQPNPTGS